MDSLYDVKLLKTYFKIIHNKSLFCLQFDLTMDGDNLACCPIFQFESVKLTLDAQMSMYSCK